eukprot:6172966-Pleurochrysis_carterae.AAC.1
MLELPSAALITSESELSSFLAGAVTRSDMGTASPRSAQSASKCSSITRRAAVTERHASGSSLCATTTSSNSSASSDSTCERPRTVRHRGKACGLCSFDGITCVRPMAPARGGSPVLD